jgi:hypothetical protein
MPGSVHDIKQPSMLVRWLLPALLLVVGVVIGWLALHKKDPEATEACRSAADSECNECCKSSGAALGTMSVVRIGGVSTTQCTCRK